jgi:hypothetical protein
MAFLTEQDDDQTIHLSETTLCYWVGLSRSFHELDQEAEELFDYLPSRRAF